MIKFFARHPTAANLLMLVLLILGISALSSLKRETFPEYAPPYISVSVAYPGASPSEVEQSLCSRMEDAVEGLANIEERRCEAYEGTARLVLKLDTEADLGRMLVDVQTQINAINDFPEQSESPVVRELDWEEPVVDVAIAATMSHVELKKYAESLKQTLKLDYGVSLVKINGFSDHQFIIEIDVLALRQLGLSVADIATQVERQTSALPAGSLESSSKTLLLRVNEQKMTIDALKRLVIFAQESGEQTLLGDIASVREGFELDEQKIVFDGKPAAILKITKNKQDDSLRIKQRVADFVADQSKTLPQGVSLVMTNDLSSVLWDRLTMMVRNGWQGIALVFATMWLFFSFRYSFWVAAGLPVAFLGGLFLMANIGLSINIMSLVGLLMAIGIMMDDAIVISESIASHIDRGQSIDQAVYNGVMKVFPGVLSSYLTTICIFGSLLFLEGQMGAVLKVVPMVLILVLTLSLVEAFLILPRHLSHSLSKQNSETPPWRFKQRLLDGFERVRNTHLVTAVTLAVRFRYLFAGSVGTLFLICVALLVGGAIRFQPFPELDGDVAEARVILPPGSSLTQTESVVVQVIAAAKRIDQQWRQQHPSREGLIEHVTEQYNFNADANESGPHLATIRLDLLAAESRDGRLDDFLRAWEAEVGELSLPISLVFKQPQMGPGGRAVEIRMLHHDLALLKQASIDIQGYLTKVDGVSGVLDDTRQGKEELVVRLLPGAESYGINAQTIANQLRAAYQGSVADDLFVAEERIEVVVKANVEQAGSIDQLLNFPIVTSSGSVIALSTLAKIEFERHFVRTQRINGLPAITVMADVNAEVVSSTELLAQIKATQVERLSQKYPGLRFDFEGESKDAGKTAASMGKGFLLGLFGIFIILSFQFRSYVEPVIVMLIIPLSFIGVVIGHGVLGYALSMPSMMGFVSLAGIVVNDSILLVQYIRQHLDEGDDISLAVVQASRERFRAVFLTSITTAAGLLPLLAETSLQAQVIQPLVVSIVFGVMASTFLVLFLVPVSYAILHDFGLFKSHSSIEH
jgi:multidrug efflux pump subunit AcrB